MRYEGTFDFLFLPYDFHIGNIYYRFVNINAAPRKYIAAPSGYPNVVVPRNEERP